MPHYHPEIPHPVLNYEEKAVDLEFLNILLDFEVARRLQGEEKESYFAKEIREAGEYLDKIGDANRKGESAGTPKRIEWATNSLKLQEPLQNFKKNLEKSQKRNETKESYSPSKKKFIDQDKSDLDSVPIASAVVGFLKGPGVLDKHFHAQGNFVGYNYGEFNAFEGAPSQNHRMSATIKIITEFLGGSQARNLSMEGIHKEILSTFGGESESDGESYEEKA